MKQISLNRRKLKYRILPKVSNLISSSNSAAKKPALRKKYVICFSGFKDNTIYDNKLKSQLSKYVEELKGTLIVEQGKILLLFLMFKR